MSDEDAYQLIGWVLPDNPKALPKIKILRADGTQTELEANSYLADFRDRGLHDTGFVRFAIDQNNLPGFSEIKDTIEIREAETNILIYRKFRPDTHLELKLLRFDLRAMPDPQTEALFAKKFALYYGAVQRHPQDTFFGIANNPSAKSLYLSGSPNYQQYEQLLRERQFKVVALIRHPYEEMAERLLFAKFASTPDVPAFIADYFHGLDPLKEMVRKVKFDDLETIRAAFNAMTDEQKLVLTNPLVKTLACTTDERPKSGHVEIALSKLARMDLVGVRNRFADFKSILKELLGTDIFGDHELTALSWVPRVVEHLNQIKQARTLISLDIDLYSYTEEAISEAIG